MNVLYLTAGDSDYQSDSLLHGLKEILGPKCVDYPERDCMYTDGTPPAYGRGFTLYTKLPRLHTDRHDIEAKIRNGFFDIVFVGGKHFEGRIPVPFLDAIKESKQRVAVIDGADEIEMSVLYHERLGVYFKRENVGIGEPISFAVPESCFYFPDSTERATWAVYEPGMPYMYDTEQAYYDGYRKAWFARTIKKSGWDCLRHYEIIAAGCIPFFQGIEAMLPGVCLTLPKDALVRIVHEDGPRTYTQEFCHELARDIHEWGKRYCTTTALAERVLTRMIQ